MVWECGDKGREMCSYPECSSCVYSDEDGCISMDVDEKTWNKMIKKAIKEHDNRRKRIQ
jgi:hypothetical protein